MIRNVSRILAFAVILAISSTSNVIAAGFQFGGLKMDLASVTSAGGTTTLTKASKQIQRVTGSSIQNVDLPDTSTLSVGYWYIVTNESSATVTVRNNGGSTLASLSTNSWGFFHVTSVSGANNWNTKTSSGSSGGSGSLNITTCSASCTAGSTDDVIWVTSAATVTLRAATSTRGLYVVNLATVTDIVPAGSDTILYDDRLQLSQRGDSVLLISNGGTTWGVF